MKLRIIFSFLLIVIFSSGCISTASPPDQEGAATADMDFSPSTTNPEPTIQGLTLEAIAEKTLKEFYYHLNEGKYDQAADLYGGSYEILQGYNPDLDTEDFAGLLQAGCEFNGLMCLEVLDIVSFKTSDQHEFSFEIAFANPDGSQFVLGPCCGETEESMPPQSSFMVKVVCQDEGTCLVMDLPPYVP